MPLECLLNHLNRPPLNRIILRQHYHLQGKTRKFHSTSKEIYLNKTQEIMAEIIGELALTEMKMSRKSMITGREESVNYAENRIQIWFSVKNYHHIFLLGEM